MAWYIAHSAKGTTWKKHKYIKKVGNRYYYSSTAPNKGYGLTDSTMKDLEGLIEHKSKAYDAKHNMLMSHNEFKREQYRKEFEREVEQGRRAAEYILERYEASTPLSKFLMDSGLDLAGNATIKSATKYIANHKDRGRK